MILIEWQSLVVERRCKHITPIINPCAEIDQDGKPVQPRRCTAYADMFNDFCPHHAWIAARGGPSFAFPIRQDITALPPDSCPVVILNWSQE